MFQTTNQIYIHIYIYIWLVVGGFNPSEKYEFVTWEYDIPNWMESHKIQVPNHQPDIMDPYSYD